MTDNIKIQCEICAEYIDANVEICPFCGEKNTKFCQVSSENQDVNNENKSEDAIDNSSVQSVEEENSETETKDNFFKNNLGLLLWIVAAIVCIFASFAVFYVANNNTTFSRPDTKVVKENKQVATNDKQEKQNLEKAKELYKSEKYEDAAVLLQKEIDKNNDAVANYYMGEVYRAQGYLKIAIDYYKIADSRKANFFEAKKRLAMTYQDKNDVDNAIDYGEKAYSLNKKDKELLNTLIHLYKIEENDDKLLVLYQDLVKIDSKNYDANDYLAAYHFKRDNYKEAAKYIETLLSIKYNTDIAYILAVCYAKVEYYTQAIRVLNLIEKNDSYEYYNVQNYKENMQYLRDSYNYSHGRY